MQVIIQGKDDEAAMFLVNENGVIKSIATCNEHARVVTDQSHNMRGAPLAFGHAQVDVSGNCSKALMELGRVKEKIASLKKELAVSMTDLSSVKASLAKERQKSK